MALKDTISEIESRGFKVKIRHIRIRNERHEIEPKGGSTYAEIVDGGITIAADAAICSEEDNYNRRLGATIALGRAKKQLDE